MTLVSGLTRTSVQRNHALIAPDSHVTAPLPGWINAAGIILISPQMGARFSMYFAALEKDGASAAPADGMQRFIYVLEGEVMALGEGLSTSTLTAGSYGYFPAGCRHDIKAMSASRLVIFEKPFSQSPDGAMPHPVIGHQNDVSSAAFMGDQDAQLKVLLPVEQGFDMAVNLFTFERGTTLPFVETHVMEHGLLMTAGGGVYRLDDRWYPVTMGDVIWMAPYCPQWFVAAGKTSSTYLYYKDVHRDPLVMK